MGETDSIEDAVECDYIGEEGADAEVLAGACGVYGRYVTLLRDESGPEPHILNFCEITISGYSSTLDMLVSSYLFAFRNRQCFHR